MGQATTGVPLTQQPPTGVPSTPDLWAAPTAPPPSYPPQSYPPAPPYGYVAPPPPPPYPPAYYYPQYAYPQVPQQTPSLDAEVAATKHIPGRWFLVGLAQVLGPICVMLVIGILIAVSGLPTHGSAGSLYSVVASVAAITVVWLTTRALARRYGGYRLAFGLGKPERSDARRILGWTLLQAGVRIGLAILIASISPQLADGHGGNMEGIGDDGPIALALDLVTAVVLAPLMEELAFRGVVLRGLMRRMPFLPAAAISSLLFGSLHTLGAAHAAGIPLLVLMTSVFGFLQCLLVRRTGRLAPAMGVHALSNALVFGLAAL